MLWENMSPDGGGEPGGELASAIDSAFGSFSDFQAKVKETGVNQFGSGWSWLVLDGSNLAVVGSANQDNPISDGKIPLLGVDVWEHAYYLKYQNRRPDYIDAWWNVVNWPKVAERFTHERLLGERLQNLVLLQENYPALKADANFRDLSAKLVEVEDALQYARRFYNGAVQQYVTRIDSFPDVIMAKAFRFQPMPFFETADRAPVKVTL